MSWREYRWEILIFGCLALIYLLTQNPYAGFGDGLGFLYYGERDFYWETNATSHFLYTNLNHLVLILLPFLPPARVLGGMSTLFALLALFQLYLLVWELQRNRLLAVLAVVMMGLSFSWWRQAVSIEVYALNGFLVMRMVLLLVRSAWRPFGRSQWQIGFWYGLALLTHIQNILLLPLFLYHLWHGFSRRQKGTGWSLLVGLLLTSVLFLPPLLAETNSIRAIFFDRQFGDAVLGLDLGATARGFVRSLGYLVYNFHVFLPLLLWGLVRWWREENIGVFLKGAGGGTDKPQALSLLLLGTALLFWLFAMRYDVTDNYVFFLYPYFVIVALGIGGCKALLNRWSRLRPEILLGFCLLLSPLFYGGGSYVLTQVKAVQTWAQPKAFKGGVYYYFWPGRSQAPDPLQLAREIREGQREAIPDFDRYEMALEYLEWQEESGDLPESP
jgi:hypothetical protein